MQRYVCDIHKPFFFHKYSPSNKIFLASFFFVWPYTKRLPGSVVAVLLALVVRLFFISRS